MSRTIRRWVPSLIKASGVSSPATIGWLVAIAGRGRRRA
jgi:hypothetical protein